MKAGRVEASFQLSVYLLSGSYSNQQNISGPGPGELKAIHMHCVQVQWFLPRLCEHNMGDLSPECGPASADI